MKWRAFHRSLAVGHQPAHAINALLRRLPIHHNTTKPLTCILIPLQWKPHLKLVARSLIEWLAESGLTMAHTETFTPDQERVRARNVISLRQVAQEIHLWFDPEIHDPDLPLLPLHSYVTDGSFKIEAKTYADILTPEQELRHHGTGAAGIVITPAARDRSPYPHTILLMTRTPQPGMSAYAWELLAQLVALKLTQHYPAHLPGYSDCMATIYRMNTALSTFHDHLGFTTAGILSSSAHCHSSITRPRLIQHVKAHPERDADRTANPSVLDRAIFLADAVAGKSTTKLGRTYINHIPHTLILEDVFEELIPENTWHLRNASNTDIPVLDLPWRYQHEYQLHRYLSTRDAYSTGTSSTWSSTSIDFASVVHPLPKKHAKSFWHAARRTLMLYDWMGHSHNQMKRSKTPLLELATCSYCGKHDNQEHIMLECSHPLLQPIRDNARQAQYKIAHDLRLKYSSRLTRYFIEQLTHASWTMTPTQTRRIWLGMWSQDTLQSLLPTEQTLANSMSTSDRYTYHTIVRLLTAPLIEAYRQMIKLQLPTQDTRLSGHMPSVAITTRRHTKALFYHDTNSTIIPHMATHTMHTPPNTFTYTNAAFSLADAEIGI